MVEFVDTPTGTTSLDERWVRDYAETLEKAGFSKEMALFQAIFRWYSDQLIDQPGT